MRWIKNWIAGRTQAVRVGDSISSNRDVTSSVPQGSVLGPTLFYIFIDDIDDCAREIELILKFADDTKGLHEVAEAKDRDKLQATLDNMIRWADKWSMSFNIEKCKIMHVGAHNPCFNYTMRGVPLQVVDEEKDIGVLVHKSLKPAKHCDKISKIAGAVLGQLSRNFHYRDRHIFKNLYIQYVRPHLEFASPAWAPWTERDREVIERVQKRAVAMISGMPSGMTYEQKCAEIGLETLDERRRTHDTLQTYKILNGIDRVDAAVFTTQINRARITRASANPKNLIVPYARLEVRKNSYFVRAPELWNRLNSNIKDAPSIKCFKHALKRSSPGERWETN